MPVDAAGTLITPVLSEPMVLVAIVTEADSGIHDKFVWLAKPR
jgi:hypothetical protein